jgi:hypothetical protein
MTATLHACAHGAGEAAGEPDQAFPLPAARRVNPKQPELHGRLNTGILPIKN